MYNLIQMDIEEVKRIRKLTYLENTKKKNNNSRKEYLKNLIRINEIIDFEWTDNRKNLLDSKLYCIQRIKEIDLCNKELEEEIDKLF